jgi:Superfamily II DNA and RNA helicases
VILDEADRLLDMGFAPEVKRLLSKCPTNRQTALFSATLQGEVQDLARRFTKNPAQVAIEPERVNLAAIEQIYIEVLDEDKVKALEELLKKYDIDQVLIFRTRSAAWTSSSSRSSAASTRSRRSTATSASGSASARSIAFRDGSLPMLVATNVAARGSTSRTSATS